MSSRIFLVLLLALVVGASMLFQDMRLETFEAIKKQKENMEIQTIEPGKIVSDAKKIGVAPN
jgi:hypothetical protein